MRVSRPWFVLALSVVMAGVGSACGGGAAEGTRLEPDNDSGSGKNPTGDDASMSIFSSDGSSVFVMPDAGIATMGPDVNGPLAITPVNPTIDVTYGQTPTAMQFSASVNGYSVPASFSIDRGEIGVIAASTGLLTPSGTIGGAANVSATYGSQRVTTTLTIRLHFVQNGAPSGDDAGAGDAGIDAANAGGNGGVGGEGMGAPVDPATQALLQAGPEGGTVVVADGGADGGTNALAWLYPYDQTVWPRGLLAPLLQWNAPLNYDAVFIHLSENAFDYQGFFSATATPFVHHPIPQAAWDLLCNSNQGEKATVTLIFSSGGEVYGPLTETWTIAQGSLTGTVYYNSYGTNLAHNYTSNGVTFGGATLAIKHGATSPVLVAGNDSECRVCHSVSADGSRLVTADGNGGDPASAWYDLKNGYAETAMTPADGRFNWGGLSPDGTLLMNNGAMNKGGIDLVGSAATNGGPLTAQLFSVATGAAYASTGIPGGLVVGSPVFSPDGSHVAFNFYSGTVGTTAGDAGATGDAGGSAEAGAPLVGDGVSLAAMDYDAASSVFSNFRILYTPAKGTSVWPSFSPTNNAVIFELETQSNGRDWGGTRSPCDSTACASESTKGTQAELWWVDMTTKMAARLDVLNGQGYLPTMPATDHVNDAVLNYEPTVSPVPSGGYSWVVFTSRRLYGNVATLKPYWSDPRYVNLQTTPTPKKLWVAAVDLNGTAGTDTSHPAFYLPAQELLAGNSRGYWVVDPCEQNGASCATGDQCCGGYCENMTCSAQPPACSSLNDKCSTDDDCCGVALGTTCVNERCAQPAPPPPVAPITPK
jgi:hypothetical protein